MPFFPQFSNLFVPPYIPPPSISPSILLHMNGSNGSTTFTDSSLNNFSVTAIGNAQISTSEFKYGGASGYFDSDGSYLNVSDQPEFNFETGDFTIECWVYIIGSGLQIICSKWDADGSNSWQLYYNDGTIVFQDSGSNYPVDGTITSEQWTHLAVTRESGTLRYFLDGVLQDFVSDVTSNITGTAILSIGANDNGLGGANLFYGYMDDFRIVKGLAVYTSNFTPPASQLPDP